MKDENRFPFFRLDVASLCEDCQHIVDSFDACPVCTSKALLPLAPILNRTTHSTCQERVFDAENAAENRIAWNMYGSELAGDFGTKPCGEPVYMGDRCQKHFKVKER